MAPSLSAWTPRTDRFRPARIAAAALDLLLPPTCVTCDTATDEAGLLCAACHGALTIIGDPCCACCGAPFELDWHAAEGNLCQQCLDTPPPFQRARAALVYDRASRRLILPFKHADRIEFAPILARLMALVGRPLLAEADILVPVPLHRRRLFFRRYNQSALLARCLGRLAGRAILLDALRRTSATASLGGKSAAERRDEVADAFVVRARRSAALTGRRVLLIDDVMTSGATASACAETLLRAGAAAVDVLVAVRVPDPRQKLSRGRYRPRRTSSEGARDNPAAESSESDAPVRVPALS